MGVSPVPLKEDHCPNKELVQAAKKSWDNALQNGKTIHEVPLVAIAHFRHYRIDRSTNLQPSFFRLRRSLIKSTVRSSVFLVYNAHTIRI